MKVYKYRGIEQDVFERDIAAFKNNQFYAPKFEMLNDPFEANFEEVISNTLDLINNFFQVDTVKIKEQLKGIIELKHQLGIFSLSETYGSEQMWAYYASSHRGYCIEYDIDKLKDKTKNFDFAQQIEVIYSDEIPILDIQDIKGELMLRKMFGVKTKNWKHEREVRLIFDNSSIKYHHESAITGIYFGYKTDENHIKTIKNTFKDRSVRFYKLKPNRLNNKLEPQLIFESKKQTKFDINKYDFEILKYENNMTVENFYIYLKQLLTTKDLREFVAAFRESHCFKPSNLNIFNTNKISKLIGIYPLRGADYINFAEAFIALADFSDESFIFEYPYKDLYYEELISHSK